MIFLKLHYKIFYIIYYHAHNFNTFRRHQFDNAEGSFKHSRRRSSTKESINEETEGDVEKESLHPFLRPLNMEFHLDYKQDTSLATAYVNCKNLHKALR